MNFSDINLKPVIQEQVAKRGFELTTPVQEKTMPLLLSKQDLIACAKTGSGKTMAFVLPLLNILSEEAEDCPPKMVRALILSPTRELAVQIYEEAVYFSENLSIRLASVYGGQDYEKQKKKVQKGVDLLIATPGRLLDFYKSKDLFLEEIKYVVLDEADRMLDMGFIDDVKHILGKIKSIENISLWSATLDYNVFYSIWSYMDDPKEVLINPEWVDKSNVSQQVLHLGSDEKLPYTLGYCGQWRNEPLIIFTNTRDMVDTLANALTEYGITAKGLSSMIHQKKRLQILEDFKKKKFFVLVATDLASRGLHVDDIARVINYDIPQDVETYVHRIGRTARAGKKGMSLSICSERDYEAFEKIEDYLSDKIPTLEPDTEILDRLNSIKRSIYSYRRRSRQGARVKPAANRAKTSARSREVRSNSHKKFDSRKGKAPIKRKTGPRSSPARSDTSHQKVNFDDYPASNAPSARKRAGGKGFLRRFKKVFS